MNQTTEKVSKIIDKVTKIIKEENADKKIYAGEVHHILDSRQMLIRELLEIETSEELLLKVLTEYFYKNYDFNKNLKLKN